VKETDMADDKPKKKGGILKWILLVFILLLLGAAGGWYYFFSTLPGSRNAALSAGDAAARPAAKPAELKDVLPTKDLQPFLVNLSDPLGRRYIKLTFEVEMANAEVGAEIDRQGAKIRDTVIMLLSSKSYADLVPTENKLQLQNELVERINRVLGGPKITRVFFTDMVIQ
jgi:flagellar FliL protein